MPDVNRFEDLVVNAVQVLQSARDQVFESAKLSDVGAVFAELAKAEAMREQARALDRLASEVGRLANAVQMRR